MNVSCQSFFSRQPTKDVFITKSKFQKLLDIRPHYDQQMMGIKVRRETLNDENLFMTTSELGNCVFGVVSPNITLIGRQENGRPLNDD